MANIDIGGIMKDLPNDGRIPKTKIVCTLGPSSRSVVMLEKLLRAGMNVARFNFSHGTHDYHQETLNNLRTAMHNTQILCAIMLDTKGPEIRTGFLNGAKPIQLKEGQEITITIDYDIKGDQEMISMKAWMNPRSVNITNPTTTADYFASQWVDPGDIFSVLLLLGPEIVQQAVAQLAGRKITPVAFSFGWVAYSATALLSMIGDGRLMPETDMLNTLVIGADSKHVRTTSSWILGRLLRDLEDRYDEEMEGEEPHIPPSQSVPAHPRSTEKEKGISHQQRKLWQSLRISVYEVINEKGYNHGVPHCDWVWYSGFMVILMQLVIAMLPWVLHGEWGTFLVTAYGNFLALLSGSLPQWRREKWACLRNGGATVTITQGNGSRHAIVILGQKGVGLDLEVLARGTRTFTPSRVTRLAAALLAIQWIGLLITADGLAIDTWYLLGIGALGSIQNLIAAGARRSPSALGVHIREIGQPIQGNGVPNILKAAEQQYPGLGMSLVPIFFPGSMRVQPFDFDFWRAANEREMGPNNYGTRIDNLPSQSSTIQKRRPTVVADVREHDMINTE